MWTPAWCPERTYIPQNSRRFPYGPVRQKERQGKNQRENGERPQKDPHRLLGQHHQHPHRRGDHRRSLRRAGGAADPGGRGGRSGPAPGEAAAGRSESPASQDRRPGHGRAAGDPAPGDGAGARDAAGRPSRRHPGDRGERGGQDHQHRQAGPLLPGGRPQGDAGRRRYLPGCRQRAAGHLGRPGRGAHRQGRRGRRPGGGHL